MQASLPTESATTAPKNGAPPTETPAPAPSLKPLSEAESQAIVRAGDDPGGAISAFSSQRNFESAQRMARALASSSLVPEAYRQNIPNVLIAMELASRIGASVFMVMQSLDIIHGRPSWRAQFLIATVNASKRFTPLRFKFSGKEGSADWGCRAVAKDLQSGEECIGSLITLAMAKEEGWATKAGSKWKTMPEQMLMYRAGSFWTRVYCPELALGMGTREEAIDTYGEPVVEGRGMPAELAPGSPQSLEAELLGKKSGITEDGEIVEPGSDG